MPRVPARTILHRPGQGKAMQATGDRRMSTAPEAFRTQIADLTAQLAGRPLDAELDAWLNREHGATPPHFLPHVPALPVLSGRKPAHRETFLAGIGFLTH